MNEVRASVIIPTHNRIEKLAQTLACLADQTVQLLEYEIVVVDDGSSPAVILPECSAGPRRVVVRLEGCERSKARNRGAAAATSEVLIFVDDDITVGRNFVEAHMQAHREWPDALVVGSMRLTDSMLATPFGRFRQSLEQNGIPSERGITSMRNLCTAANMSVSRQSFETMGGFDVSLASSEDQDFALRFTNRGGRIAFVPEAEAVHDDHALDIRTYCRRVEWGAEHQVGFYLRHPGWPENIEREMVNGSLKPFREPLRRTLRKLLKLVVGSTAVERMIFALASVLERRGADSRALELIYRLLLGSHILRGYRRGLKRYGPLSDQRQVTCPAAFATAQGSSVRDE